MSESGKIVEDVVGYIVKQIVSNPEEVSITMIEQGPDEVLAEVRGLEEGQDAVSPSTFTDLESPADFRKFADRVRERSGEPGSTFSQGAAGPVRTG